MVVQRELVLASRSVGKWIVCSSILLDENDTLHTVPYILLSTPTSNSLFSLSVSLDSFYDTVAI